MVEYQNNTSQCGPEMNFCLHLGGEFPGSPATDASGNSFIIHLKHKAAEIHPIEGKRRCGLPLLTLSGDGLLAKLPTSSFWNALKPMRVKKWPFRY